MPTLTSRLVMTQVATPFGDVSVFATDADGVVRMSGFGTPERISMGHAHAVDAGDWVEGDNPAARAAIEAWLDGEVGALARVEVDQPGGPFMQRAWEELAHVPAGEVITYQELAERAGSPRAARAAGQACARNAVAPFVPCHRVVSSTGLGDYGYGLDLKQRMLAHEGVTIGRGA
jgi:methylated-DNA-[protein]-cysteine S-methyltransferase